MTDRQATSVNGREHCRKARIESFGVARELLGIRKRSTAASESPEKQMVNRGLRENMTEPVAQQNRNVQWQESQEN